MDVRRRKDETAFEHHRRLILDKVVNRLLPDTDYAELSDLVYGQHYSSDVARRMMYGSAKTLQMAQEEGAEQSGPELDEMERQRIEMRKERQRLMDQRRIYENQIERQGRLEHIEDRLLQAADRLESSVGVLYDEDLTGRLRTGGGNEAVLVLSDWHYGMTTDNIWNTYNKEICRERVGTLVRKAADKLELHRCARLHIVLLGDMVDGAIHVDSRVQSDELVADQLMQVSEILAQTIYELSQAADETVVYSTYGNHGRVSPDIKESVHRDNFERLIPFWLKARLQNNKSIAFADESGTEFLHFPVGKFSFCAVHGDCDKKKTRGALPLLYEKTQMDSLDYLLIGHWHSREDSAEMGVETFVCGALCGADDFANKKRLYSRPEQLMLIVDEEEGVDAVYHLKV